jgi:hypothetical protein
MNRGRKQCKQVTEYSKEYFLLYVSSMAYSDIIEDKGGTLYRNVGEPYTFYIRFEVSTAETMKIVDI